MAENKTKSLYVKYVKSPGDVCSRLFFFSSPKRFLIQRKKKGGTGTRRMSFRRYLSRRKAERSGLGALAGGRAIHHGDRVVNGLCNSVSDE